MKKTRLPDSVCFCGIRYRVSEHEGLIVFSEDQNIYGVHTRMAFSRPKDCGWYFEFSASFGKVMVGHVVAAYEFLCMERGDDFNRTRDQILFHMHEAIERSGKEILHWMEEVARLNSALLLIAEPEMQDKYSPQEIAKHALRFEPLKPQ